MLRLNPRERLTAPTQRPHIDASTMTPAQLRADLEEKFLDLLPKLIKSYCKREDIQPNHYLRGEVTSAAGLAVATVLHAMDRGTTPDNPIAYVTTAIIHEMTRACIEDIQDAGDKDHPRCQFSGEHPAELVVDGDHMHQPYADDEPIDWLARFTDPIDRDIAAEISMGTPRGLIAERLGINRTTVYRRLKQIESILRASRIRPQDA